MAMYDILANRSGTASFTLIYNSKFYTYKELSQTGNCFSVI